MRKKDHFEVRYSVMPSGAYWVVQGTRSDTGEIRTIGYGESETQATRAAALYNRNVESEMHPEAVGFRGCPDWLEPFLDYEERLLWSDIVHWRSYMTAPETKRKLAFKALGHIFPVSAPVIEDFDDDIQAFFDWALKVRRDAAAYEAE